MLKLHWAVGTPFATGEALLALVGEFICKIIPWPAVATLNWNSTGLNTQIGSEWSGVVATVFSLLPCFEHVHYRYVQVAWTWTSWNILGLKLKDGWSLTAEDEVCRSANDTVPNCGKWSGAVQWVNCATNWCILLAYDPFLLYAICPKF